MIFEHVNYSRIPHSGTILISCSQLNEKLAEPDEDHVQTAGGDIVDIHRALLGNVGPMCNNSQAADAADYNAQSYSANNSGQAQVANSATQGSGQTSAKIASGSIRQFSSLSGPSLLASPKAVQHRESVIRFTQSYKPSRLLELLVGTERQKVNAGGVDRPPNSGHGPPPNNSNSPPPNDEQLSGGYSGLPQNNSPTAALDSLKISSGGSLPPSAETLNAQQQDEDTNTLQSMDLDPFGCDLYSHHLPISEAGEFLSEPPLFAFR